MKNRVDTNCPICGNSMEEGFHLGDICPCCGNESGFGDDITCDELIEKFEQSVLEKFSEQIKEELSRSAILDKTTAWMLLRTKWIRGGCRWKYESMPIGWDEEKGKQQLLSIGFDINEYEWE